MSLERRFPNIVSAYADPALRPRARAAVSLGAAVVLACVGLFGVNIPTSSAQGGLFETLFGSGGGGGRIEAIEWRSSGTGHRHGAHLKRHVSHHARYHFAHPQIGRPQKLKYAHLRRHVPGGRHVAEATTAGRRTVCVRSCDGYFFPIVNGPATSAARQESCSKLCPGAEAHLYVMRSSDKIEDAVSTQTGQTYAALVERIASANKPQSCSCHSTAGVSVDSKAFLEDPTLRPGDSVVTPEGVRVVRGGSRYPFQESDFLSLAETRDVPKATRGALAAIENALKTPRGRASAANDKHHDERHRRKDLRSDASEGRVTQ